MNNASDFDSITPEHPEEKHLHPGFELNLTQLDLLNNEPSRCLAVRFRHGDLDMPGGMRLERVSPSSNIGKVRDACLQRGLKLVITETSFSSVEGVIVDASVSEEDAKRMFPSNRFRKVEHEGMYEGSYLPELLSAYAGARFCPRSFGVATVDISKGPYFAKYAAAEAYLKKQYEDGFRGRVLIQAEFAMKGGGAEMPFVSEIQINDDGLKIDRNEVLLERKSTGKRLGSID